MEPVEIIAEIGTSHQGDIRKARELIRAAGDAGADTVKFQWVIAPEIIHPLTGDVPLPGGSIPLFDRFRALEKDRDFYGELKVAAESCGLSFLCTPFGIASAEGLLSLGVKRCKVASPELNHLELLEYLGASGADLVISSGVSRISDIEEALETVAAARAGHFHLAPVFHLEATERLLANRIRPFHEVPLEELEHPSLQGNHGVQLLHCITSYPAPEEEYNLLLIPFLSLVFGLPTGLSDHSLDPSLVPGVATLLGAGIIEKHFTLSRDDPGLDDPIALDPSGFASMCRTVRSASGQSASIPCRVSIPEMVRHCCDAMGALGIPVEPDRMRAILGTGHKELAGAERANYGRTNRSIHARQAIPAGTVLGSAHMDILRTEKVLRPGLHPRYAPLLVGRTVRQDIPEGEGIRWQDIF